MNQKVNNQEIFKPILIWALIAIILAFLVYDRHKDTGTFNWMTPLWADQAGYYVYLPAFFIYDFNADYFPERIDEKTGEGFSFDRETNKVITRYSCGVALLQAPFFLIIHIFALLSGQPPDGFSGIYHQVPNLAALFYAISGLFFLWHFLRKYYKWHVTATTILILFLGTNLFYYTIDSTGMSHIYSFALFAAIARVTQIMLSVTKEKQWVFVFAWSLLFALIVLVRPTNVMFFPFLFTLELNSPADLINRIKTFANVRNILILMVSFLIVFAPQFLYWKYLSGSYIHYSYGEYGFTNLTSPKILQLWFSPNNGMFLYNPIYLVVIAAMVIKLTNKKSSLNDYIIPVTFLALTYVFSAWFIFSFGCGYGSRNFVEYNVMFAIPMAYFIKRIGKMNNRSRVSLSLIIIFMVFFNIRLLVLYNRCYQGGDWDFKEYTSYFYVPEKYHDKVKIGKEERILTSDIEFSKSLHLVPEEISLTRFKKALVKLDVVLHNTDSEALLVLSIENQDSVVYWNSIRLIEHVPENKLNTKQRIRGEFWLPERIPENSKMATYVWNLKKEALEIHTLKITLE